jgi:hypothetical protein
MDRIDGKTTFYQFQIKDTMLKENDPLCEGNCLQFVSKYLDLKWGQTQDTSISLDPEICE